jgi:GntR family transcriptional regulator, carbon starvation induced regulator
MEQILPSLTADDSVRPISPAPGETLTEAAYFAIRRDIISGALAPEERLRIERLSRLYGVGPTPLREALQRLCAAGLVHASGNKGFAVAPLSMDEFLDLTIARVAIEEQALRLSIEHGDDAWESQVAATAYQLNKKDVALIASGEVVLSDWEAANSAFHAATVAACGSRWLLTLRARLNEQVERYRLASVALRRTDRDLVHEHADIATAVLNRDADRASALIAQHFRKTASLLAGA